MSNCSFLLNNCNSILCLKISRSQVSISLHPYNANDDKLQRTKLIKAIPCFEDGMRHFRELDVETKILLSRGGYRMSKIGTEDNDCFSCIESWKYWLNPFHWGDNIWTSTRIVMALTLFICTISVLGLCIRMCACLKCCCSS